MCFGMGCKYECQYGENVGECRKPPNATCPQDIWVCKNCEEEFDYELENDTCEQCAKDEKE